MNLTYKNDNKKIVKVTKEFTFDSCHKLYEYMGKCANLHGHTYKLQVTIKGTQKDNGLVIDFNDLKRIVEDLIIDVVDHKCLHNIFNFNTTAENLSRWIYDSINIALLTDGHTNCKVHSIKLWETPTSFAEYEGEEI